jgi:hypothetical protein
MLSRRAEGRQVKTARPLTSRQWLKGVWCGVTGVPFEIYEADVKASLVEEAAPVDEGRAKEKRPSRSAERKLVEKEAQEQESALETLKALLPTARALVEDLRRRFSQLRIPPLYLKAMVAWLVAAIVLLLGDAAASFSAVADASGIDFSARLGAISLVALLGVGGITVILVAGNAFAGSAATAEDPPLRRLLGCLGLGAFATIIGLVRGYATPDPSFIMTLVYIALSVASGLIAGKAHHVLADYFRKRAETNEFLRAAREPLAEAERNLAELERRIAEGTANRKRLALALDALDAEPVTHARSNEELRNIQAAQLAKARLVYEAAAKFARGRKREEGKNA